MLDELQLMAEEEVKAFHIYGDKYRALNPLPAKPSPIKQGWEFKAYLLVSIASVLLASMRTAEQFYRAAVFSSATPVLGFVEAFLAVFTVEAGIVVYAAVMASRSRKISPWVLGVGIVLLAAISITAGMAQSLHLATDVDPMITHYVEIALSLLIGPGASIAALIGGHILGQQIAMAAKQYEELLEAYDGEVEEYNLKLKKSWERSDERKTAKRSALARAMGQQVAHMDTDEISTQTDDRIQTQMDTQPVESPVQEPVHQQVPSVQETQVTQVPEPIASKPVHKTEPVIQAIQDAEPVAAASMSVPAPARMIRPGSDIFPEEQKEASNGHKNGKSNGNLSKLDPTLVRKMQQAVTKWLVQNNKTPFDDQLNFQTIGKDIGLDPQYVAKIVETMRATYRGHF